MKKVLLFIYTIWALLVFHVFMIILFPVFIIPPLLHKRGDRITFKALRLWSHLFSFFNQIRYKISGQENIDTSKNYIFVVNHTSFLDTPALPQTIDMPFKPLAKKELTRIPIFGLLIRAVTIIVDRSNAKSRQESLNKLNRILAEESSILIFPEGTMNRTKQPLQRFYDGAFRTAIETQAELLPIVVKGAGKLMKPGSLVMRPGKIEVDVLPPIKTEGLTQMDLPALKEQTFNAMLDRLQ